VRVERKGVNVFNIYRKYLHAMHAYKQLGNELLMPNFTQHNFVLFWLRVVQQCLFKYEDIYLKLF